MSRIAFIIMPIRKEGSPEHAHFRALYEDFLKPTLMGAGYGPIRADEIQKSGAITRDIILKLAEADLVVADLTDLNPNVFYELGVRHALRGRGTVMILDEGRTDAIPFDLHAYRCIRFRSDLPGIRRLRQELTAFLAGLGPLDQERDNPVHDWIPTLPINATKLGAHAGEEGIRDELLRLRRMIKQYEEKYGSIDLKPAEDSPLARVTQILLEAENQNLPSDLIQQADDALEKRDHRAFLGVAKRTLEGKTFTLSVDQFGRLAAIADTLGLHEVGLGLLEHACQVHKINPEIHRLYLQSLAHSNVPKHLAEAKSKLLAELGIRMTSDSVELPRTLREEDLALFGILLDTLLAQNQKEEMLRLTSAALQAYPDRSVVARNHARALEASGKGEEALEYYKRAIHCVDANDATAVWLGNALHNREMFVESTEAYLLACVMDYDDGRNFSYAANALSKTIMISGHPERRREMRSLPPSIGREAIELLIVAALSCRLLDQEGVSRVKRAAARIGVSERRMKEIPQLLIGERSDLARKLYGELKTPLTSLGQTISSASG